MINTYISTHAHSDYSNLKFPDAINTVESLIDSAYQLGLSGVALTDHDTVSGYIRAEHHMAKRKKENPDDERWQNFKLILGNEIYLCKNGLTKENYDKEQDRYYHFILLAKDKIGNDQIRKLSSKAWTRSYMYFHRRIPTYWSDLEEVIQTDQGHVIGTTACLGGQVPSLITRRAEYEVGSEEYNSYTEALYRIFDKLVSIFGKEDFYVELQPGLTPEQKLVNVELLKFSAELGIKPIVSTDAHYGNKEERGVHRAYLNSKKGDREVDAFYEAAYLMDTEEIRERMDYLDSEVLDTLFQNTLDIGAKCEEYSLLKDLRIPYLPQDRFEQELQVPLIGAEKYPHFMKYYNSNEAADKQLAIRVWNFLQTDKSVGSKFDTKMAAVERELGIIWESSEKMKVRWSKYFLQMADYMEIIWTDGDSITAPSRGSGGASYLMYILGIIQIDPTEETAPLMFERFINPDRASVLDVDTDVESSKRRKVIAAMQNVYGEDHVVRVATFKTEKTKSTIINSARGLGIDADTASYIAGLVGQERGIQYDLKTMYYGDEERGITPHPTFVKEMNKRPKLWAMCQRIEGLINGIGVHAGGIIIDDKPIYNSASVIKTTKGEIVTAFDLHDCEAASLIKIDLLATKGLSKIRTTLDLLADHGYIEREETLKETYEKVIGVYNLDRKSKEMWEMIHRHEVASLFQMEQQSGIQGIYLTKPTTLEDLAALNSIIRLMASEPGAELPLEKYARYRKDPKAWDNEMDVYGLSEEEKALMHQMFDYSSGVAAQQEDLYQVILEPKIAGFSFGEADVLRKIVAKKQMDQVESYKEKIFKNAKEKGLSMNLVNYVWEQVIAPQVGYSFNLAHTFSYSIVALQEMNLAYNYPIVFWNTANLIVDAGAEYESDEDYDNEESDFIFEDDEDLVAAMKVDYGKIASAIGTMQQAGIKVSAPNINTSGLTFTPDPEKGEIYYGLSGITRVGGDVVNDILANRPYESFADFRNKISLNITQLVSLIKADAFREFGEMRELMREVLEEKADKKTRLTLQNANMLFTHNLIPEEFDFNKRVFYFNKYIKNREFWNKASGTLLLNQTAFPFYAEHFSLDDVEPSGSDFTIKERTWKTKYYDKYMLPVKHYITQNEQELLTQLNEMLYDEVLDKYAQGTDAKWSMDALSFYRGEHELDALNNNAYGIQDFFELPREPQIDYSFTTKDGNEINMMKLTKIAGTVIDKDKGKQQVVLLTTSGVVIVKAYGTFAHYDKQISKVGAAGKKEIVQRSMFSRGNKLVVNGMRRGDQFIAKKYKNSTVPHTFMQIGDIDEKGFITYIERLEQDGE